MPLSLIHCPKCKDPVQEAYPYPDKKDVYFCHRCQEYTANPLTVSEARKVRTVNEMEEETIRKLKERVAICNTYRKFIQQEINRQKRYYSENDNEIGILLQEILTREACLAESKAGSISE